MGVEYIDGTVVGADLKEDSPSSVKISSLHIHNNSMKMKNDQKMNEIENVKNISSNLKSKNNSNSNSNNLVGEDPNFKISAGVFINAAGMIDLSLFVIFYFVLFYFVLFQKVLTVSNFFCFKFILFSHIN